MWRGQGREWHVLVYAVWKSAAEAPSRAWADFAVVNVCEEKK